MKYLFAYIELTLKYQKELPIKHLEDNVEKFIERLLFTKADIWEYEDEYRLIKINASRSSIKVPLDSITEITLGCEISIEAKNEIISIVKKQIPSCKIYEASLSKTKFELDINLKPEA